MPLASEAVERASAVCALAAVIVVPGTTDPEASVTVAEDAHRSLRQRGGRHYGQRQSEATGSPDHDVPPPKMLRLGHWPDYTLIRFVPAACLLADAFKPESEAASGRSRPTFTVNSPCEYTGGWKRLPRTRIE